MVFQYGSRRKRSDLRAGRAAVNPATPEQLSGQINGDKASDIEERFARGLAKVGVGFQFRVRISSQFLGRQYLTQTRANMPGEVEMDFVVQGKPPVFIDGQIGHFYTEWQSDEDALKTNAANDFMMRLGYPPAIRIPFWRLATQELADMTVREYIAGNRAMTIEYSFFENKGAPQKSGGTRYYPEGMTVTNTVNMLYAVNNATQELNEEPTTTTQPIYTVTPPVVYEGNNATQAINDDGGSTPQTPPPTVPNVPTSPTGAVSV